MTALAVPADWPITSPITLNGMSLTGFTPEGAQIGCDDVEGWGSPAPSLSVTQLPRAHGGIAGKSWLQPRTIVLGGWIAHDYDPTAVTAGLDRLYAACSLDDVQLSISESGNARWMNVRRSDQIIVTWPNQNGLYAEWSMQMVALDPRKYGSLIQPDPTHLPSSTGGLTWPVDWSISWSGVTASGIISVNNPGNIASPVKLRINGLCAGPSVRHVGQGKELVVASAYTVPSGSWLTVDMKGQTILEADKASRNAYITNYGWFALDPGPNELIFGASSYSADATLQLTAYPAWL